MTVPPMPTVIVMGLDADGGPPRKPAKQHVVSIELAERPRRSLLHPQRSLSLGTVFHRRPHAPTNCALARYRQASQHLDSGHAGSTIPIVLDHPRLRSIRLL
jgi:hypothetical protein